MSIKNTVKKVVYKIKCQRNNEYIVIVRMPSSDDEGTYLI